MKIKKKIFLLKTKETGRAQQVSRFQQLSYIHTDQIEQPRRRDEIPKRAHT